MRVRGERESSRLVCFCRKGEEIRLDQIRLVGVFFCTCVCVCVCVSVRTRMYHFQWDTLDMKLSGGSRYESSIALDDDDDDDDDITATFHATCCVRYFNSNFSRDNFKRSGSLLKQQKRIHNNNNNNNNDDKSFNCLFDRPTV